MDLYIDRTIPIGKLRMTLFLNIYNLFDQRDETTVYGDTGTADYTTTRDPNSVEYNPDRVTTVEDFVLQPSWYTAPRQIQAGLTFGF